MARQILKPYTKVLMIFIAFLFVFLVVVDTAIIRSERAARIESTRGHMIEEMKLIETYVTDAVISQGYPALEQLINKWGKRDPLVVSLTAKTPQGHTLAQFESGKSPARVMRLKQPLTYEGRHILDLVLVEDTEEIYWEMAKMANRFIVRSLIVVVLLGFISWSIFRIFALKPMEREITRRKQVQEDLLHVKNGLEDAVKKRTADLERANRQLKKEIQERKDAVQMAEVSLDEKEMLLKEIHHRVKNNLQVISGMLQVQLNRIEDEALSDMLKASQYRIMSMALVHDELYRSKELARIDFAGYVRNLVENLHRSYVKVPEKVRLHFLLEEIPLVVDTAIPCGLILNELLINAFKHAFPGQREGDITISFEELEDSTFNLAIQDNGVGFPRELDLDNTTSLGLNLVNVLVNQLHGHLKVWNKNGTRYEIHFPEYHEAGIGLY